MAENKKAPQLYTWSLRPDCWVAEDEDGKLFVFPPQNEGWGARAPFTGSPRALQPSKAHNAAGTGWPYWHWSTRSTLPDHLVSAHQWTEAAGELDELAQLHGEALARYARESADNARQNDVHDVSEGDLRDLAAWLQHKP